MTYQSIEHDTTHLTFYDRSDPNQHVGKTVAVEHAHAAPDMLEALEFALVEYRGAAGKELDDDACTNMLTWAIAKAKGTTP